MNLTLYLFKYCNLVEIKHFKDFTSMVVYLIDTVGRDTYKKMEKHYNKYHVFNADGYIGVMSNYLEGSQS